MQKGQGLPARTMKEFTELSSTSPVEGFAIKSEEPTALWHVVLAGPAGTPYEGGKFCFDIAFENYPFNPPALVFKTKLFHPNVDEEGKICQQM